MPSFPPTSVRANTPGGRATPAGPSRPGSPGTGPTAIESRATPAAPASRPPARAPASARPEARSVPPPVPAGPRSRAPASLHPSTDPGSVSGGRVTSGLYGGASVPTIRQSDEPRPRAAAIQLTASGGARMLGTEDEDEPIEVEAAEDDDDAGYAGGGGFSLTLQEYTEDEYYQPEPAGYAGSQAELETHDRVPAPQAPRAAAPRGPSAAEVQMLLDRADQSAQAGDLQGAADLYGDAIEAAPGNAGAHIARGRLFLDLGDYTRAMSDFLAAEELAPHDPEPQVAVGDLYFARKDYRKAIEHFDQALAVAPNHAMAYCRRGISHYYRKNYKEAVDDLARAERLGPDIPNIMTYLAMAKKKVAPRR